MDCDMSDVEDSSEFFWGCELNEGHREVTWSVKDESTAHEEEEEEEEDDDDDDDEDYLIHTLFIKLATLGKCAQKDEENIVQVETTTYTGDTIKQPILNMTAGVNNTIPLDLSFDGKFKVTFRLTDGVGPVYLSGQHLVEFPEDDFSQDESDYTDDTGTEMTSDDDDDDDVKKPKIKVGKKRTGSPGKSIKAKWSKLGSKGNNSDSEDDDEDDDEETVKVEKPKKKKGKIGVSPKVSGKKLSSKKKSAFTALKKAKKTPK